MRRVEGGRLLDRARALHFRFDGVDYVGYSGDTLASALLANGVSRVATSVLLGRPRGVMAAGVDEASALVGIDAPYVEPMVAATTVELCDGLAAHGLRGRGALSDTADAARYDAQHAHCDVLIVGAGPTGLIAALGAARAGARVVLLDDQPVPGGSLLGTMGELAGWTAAVFAELAGLPDVLVLARTTAFGYYDDGFVLALQNRTAHLGTPEGYARQRVWRVRAKQVIVATGALERPIAFAGNDLPGVMLAHAARTYLHRYGVLVGDRVVVCTTNDSAFVVARELAAAGAEVTVLDARTGDMVAEALGEHRVTGVRLTSGVTLHADTVLVSGGWDPAAHLYSQARGILQWDDTLAAFVPGQPVPGVHVAGAAAGELSLASCLQEGLGAGEAALAELGFEACPVELPRIEPEPALDPPMTLWAVVSDTQPDLRFVDLQRDATVSDILRATGAGLRSAEHVKRYTTIGTAHDQGKTSGVLALGITAESLGTDIAGLAPTTFRPPYTSVPFVALAGRDRGALFDPVRVTAIHPWHVEHGAVFEDVGQWKRPRYYPQPGEDMAAAVLRESAAVRRGVGMMDGSTLGKINVQGADAAVFLDRMYTNLLSTLKPGRVRYAAMCGMDGMIIDDGTVLRISETQFVLTTTTGNAAMVLDRLEEFAQTEWPELRVHLTSVTEHWATIPVVGPRSRAVLAAVAPGLDVSNDAFGFMTWRAAEVAGVPARICRISFSGELAYEVNVPSWYGIAVWQALVDAGQPHGMTLYGTETMHVLRAEKGYPIIGQDTDATVTPHDLGMSWVVSKKKPDFVGKRSFSRPENLRADRKQLVGLLPVDAATLLDEGAQILADDDVSVLPVPMLGHVTSSYDSAALGSTFALALVRSGRERIGTTLYAWSGGDAVPVTVTDAVLYDKEGARRDG